MNQRDLDLLMEEAQAEVDAEWEEFMREWVGERAPEPVAVIPADGEENAA